MQFVNRMLKKEGKQELNQQQYNEDAVFFFHDAAMPQDNFFS